MVSSKLQALKFIGTGKCPCFVALLCDHLLVQILVVVMLAYIHDVVVVFEVYTWPGIGENNVYIYNKTCNWYSTCTGVVSCEVIFPCMSILL